jgi:hydrogenase 3 maturation protease
MKRVLQQIAAIWQESSRVLFLGVGSPLRADDAVGLEIVTGLMNQFSPVPDKEVCFYLAETAPENFTGAIRDFKPDHLLIIDAAELGLEVGNIALIEQDQIGGTTFSTHMLPLKIVVDYLKITIGCQVTVIGIQPGVLEFGFPISEAVSNSANRFVAEICEILK